MQAHRFALGIVVMLLIALSPLNGSTPATATSSSHLSATAFTAIAAGLNQTCVLTSSGGVKCWGSNNNSQLGDGTVVSHSTPMDVSGLTSGVIAITAGSYHTCALTTGGGVKCWGNNSNGQLGDGTNTGRPTPVDVSTLTSGVTAIAAGAYHTCALTNGGGIKCWGSNRLGQLGNGTTTDTNTPGDVNTLTSGVTAITTGQTHTCALTTGGGVKCWGNNSNGQLGDTTVLQHSSPVDVSTLTNGISGITAGGSHTCALTTGGGVKCWGYNQFGQLGNGTTTPSNVTVPVDVSTLTSGVSAITAGGSHTCAVTSGGGAKCWGSNMSGQLGDGTINQKTAPVDVSTLTSGVSVVAAGGSHTCALTTGGGIKCWGADDFGQLGDGAAANRNAPVDVSGLTSGITAITAGWYHACALTTGGGVKCWGSNSAGQLGDNSNTQRLTPVDVSGLTNGVAAIAAGSRHTCALTTGGGVKCWGDNKNGQLGDGTNTPRNIPADVNGLPSGVAAIAAGDWHTCALTTSGGVKCWGNNGNGRLGNGSTTSSNVPVDVSTLTSGVIAIAAGGSHTCAVLTGGSVKCWGANFNGQLGDSTGVDKSTPTDVSTLTSGVAAITAGDSHTCVIIGVLGSVKCWGLNSSGQLGNNTYLSSNVPVDANSGATGVGTIAAGMNHTCALFGQPRCWGNNESGQLGDGTTTLRLAMVNVSGLTGPGTTVIGSGPAASHTCAVVNGGAKCWGENLYTQLGNNVLGYRTTPVDVLLQWYLYLPIVLR